MGWNPKGSGLNQPTICVPFVVPALSLTELRPAVATAMGGHTSRYMGTRGTERRVPAIGAILAMRGGERDRWHA